MPLPRSYIAALIAILASALQGHTQPAGCTSACERPCYFGFCPLPPRNGNTPQNTPVDPFAELDRVAVYGDWTVLTTYQPFSTCIASAQPSGSVGVEDPQSLFIAAHTPYKDIALISVKDVFVSGNSVTFETDSNIVRAVFEKGGAYIDDRYGSELQRDLAGGDDLVVKFGPNEIRFSSNGFKQAINDASRRCAL